MKKTIAALAILASTSAVAGTDVAAWAEENGYFAVAACMETRSTDNAKADDRKAACVADLMTNGYFEEAFQISKADK